MITTIPVPPSIYKDLALTPDVPGFTPVWDLGIILHLSKMSQGDILEIGCNQGGTTLQLATANPDTYVFGIDWTGEPTVCPEQKNEQDIAKVELGKAAKHLPNVIIRDINSRVYDYNTYSPGVSFVFVDGDHTYSGVRIDSEKALAHLANPSRNWQCRAIVWHDYCPLEFRDKSPAWLQVGDYLRAELAPKYAIKHFTGSAVAALLLGPWPEDIFAGF